MISIINFTLKASIAIGLVVTTTSCADSTFGGDSARRVQRAENGTNTNANNTPNSDNLHPKKTEDDLNDSPSSDDKAIGKCLAKWGNHPFDSEDFGSYRKLSASVQVLGFGKSVVDKEKTNHPKLILISAAVNVLGEAEYDLLNPNGWYCLKVDVNVKAKTKINLACNAHLADSKVDVGVLSDTEPTGMVGVHVLSDVKINRLKDCQ